MIWKTLAAPRAAAGAFAGSYEPYDAGEGICAFTRGEDVLVAVPMRPGASFEPPAGWTDALGGATSGSGCSSATLDALRDGGLRAVGCCRQQPVGAHRFHRLPARGGRRRPIWLRSVVFRVTPTGYTFARGAPCLMLQRATMPRKGRET